MWHDGGVWRAALDTTELHPDHDPGSEGAHGALADCTPMTNFRAERQFGTFSAADAWCAASSACLGAKFLLSGRAPQHVACHACWEHAIASSRTGRML